MHPSFGTIVASLRKNQFELTTGRTWSQKTLAERVGASPRFIERIEQGAKQYIDGETLTRLAEAFQLTTLERREFFSLAVDVPKQKLMQNSVSPAAVLSPLLETLRVVQQPACLHDDLFTMIAVNTSLAAFFNVDPHYLNQMAKSIESNYLYALFSSRSAARSFFQGHWRSTALRAVHQFRAISLRYRHTASFQTLFHQLCRLPDFEAIWLQTQRETEDIYTHVHLDSYTHAIWGEIQYLLTSTLTVTAYGNLYLIALAPACARSATAFSTAAAQSGKVTQLADWPSPDLIEI